MPMCSRSSSTARTRTRSRSATTKAAVSIEVTRPFEGVIPNMERRYRETDSNWIREEFERYQNNRPCGACEGFRLRPEALAVKIGPAKGAPEKRLHVGQVVQMSIREALEWVEAAPKALSKQKNEIAAAILKEIRERLGFLNNVGLEYLTLSRNAGTLSGGNRSGFGWPARSARA